MYIISKFNKSVNQKGSSLSLPAHGRAGARATSLMAAHFAKRNTKFGGGGKARAGKNSFPPNPLPFCPPERKLSKVGVRIFVEKSSDFVQDRQPIRTKRVPRLARSFAPRFGGRIFKQFPNEPIFFFARRANAKRQFSAQKRLQI